MINYPRTTEEINKRVAEIIEALQIEQCFVALDAIDAQMQEHPHALDKHFYMKKQDEINQIYNKIREYYYDLLGILETRIATRSFEMLVEYEASGAGKTITVNGEPVKLSRAPGREALADAAKSEVPDLNYAVVMLKGWKNRADNAIKTARNHTYSSEVDDSKDNDE